MARKINWSKAVERARAACEKAEKAYCDECGVNDGYDAEVTIAGNGFCAGKVLAILDRIERAFGRPVKGGG